MIRTTQCLSEGEEGKLRQYSVYHRFRHESHQLNFNLVIMAFQPVEEMNQSKGPTNIFRGFFDFENEVENGITIFGKTGGSGPPLLLLHG